MRIAMELWMETQHSLRPVWWSRNSPVVRLIHSHSHNISQPPPIALELRFPLLAPLMRTPVKIPGLTLGDDQAPLLPLRGRPPNWTRVLTSLTGGAPHWVELCSQCPCPDTTGGLVFYGSISLLVPGEVTSPCVPKVAAQWQRKWNHHLRIPDEPPRNVPGLMYREMGH